MSSVPLLRNIGAICLGLYFALAVNGQEPAPRKWVLSIGNSSYKFLPRVTSAAQDAKAVGAAFESIGFSVVEKEDLDHASLKSVIEKEFLPALQPGDTAAFYFSGYGLQVDGDNYLLPSGYNPKDKDDIAGQAYSVTRLTGLLQTKKISLTLVILDACRALPAPDPHSTRAGLASMDTGPGTVFALSNTPDMPVRGDASHYAQAIADMVQKPGLTPEQIFQAVSDKVKGDSNGAQVPFFVNMTAEIYLLPPKPVSLPKPVSPNPVSEVTPVAVPASAPAEKPPVATSPHRYYYLDPSSANPEALEFVRQRMQTKVKGLGYGGATSGYELDGPRSPIRLKSGQPQQFLVNRSETGTALNDKAFGELYLLSVKSKTRELMLGGAASFGSKRWVAAAIPVTISTYGSDVLKIVTAEPLPPGEYAFIAPDNWGAAPTQYKIADLFCFGVDPR
jgi:hypothetical protein